MVFLSKSTPPFAMSGPMNSIGLFSFSPTNLNSEPAIGVIYYAVWGSFDVEPVGYLANA